MLRTLILENGVAQRWKADDEPFRLARDEANDRQKQIFLHKVHSKVLERWFLLSLKAKYTGMIFFPNFLVNCFFYRFDKCVSLKLQHKNFKSNAVCRRFVVLCKKSKTV